MEPIHTFTSRRKLEVYLKDIWPDSPAYAVVNGETFRVWDHCRDGRVVANDYPPYNVYKLPSGTQLFKK